MHPHGVRYVFDMLLYLVSILMLVIPFFAGQRPSDSVLGASVLRGPRILFRLYGSSPFVHRVANDGNASEME